MLSTKVSKDRMIPETAHIR